MAVTIQSDLASSIRRLAKTSLALVETRLALFATDLAEARSFALMLLLLTLATAFMLGLALMLLVIFVIALFWDSYRLESIGILLLLFGLFSMLLWFYIARKARAAKGLFAATRSELARDREQFSSRSPPA